MKTFKIFTFVCLLLSLTSCNKEKVQSTEFTYVSGCHGGTKAGVYEDHPQLLILKYTSAGLSVTCTNALVNCAATLKGISNDVSIDGDVIKYSIFANEYSVSANCVCWIEEMSSIVTGLVKGGEYTIDCNCFYYHITTDPFIYKEGLNLVYDLNPQSEN